MPTQFLVSQLSAGSQPCCDSVVLPLRSGSELLRARPSTSGCSLAQAGRGSRLSRPATASGPAVGLSCSTSYSAAGATSSATNSARISSRSSFLGCTAPAASSSTATIPRRKAAPRCAAKPEDGAQVLTEFIAETLLPTKHGKFRLRGYRHTTDGGRSYTEPTAIICGKVEGQSEVLCRVHDACYTSEVLGSLKCDCAEQLQLAMEIIRDAPPGLIIYLQQEGRGIGLANKIAAYSLQEQGLDTVDANRALGLPDDCREYTSAQNILNDLGIRSIRLVTNNPRKISELQELGVEVTDRVPCIVQSQEFNEGYLAAKESRMDHMLTYDEEAEEDTQVGPFCYWNHSGEPSSAGLPLVEREKLSAATAAAASAVGSSGNGVSGGGGGGGGGGGANGKPRPSEAGPAAADGGANI